MTMIRIKGNNSYIDVLQIDKADVGKHSVRMFKVPDKSRYGIYTTVTKKTFWGYTELGAQVAFMEWVKRFKKI